MIRDDISPFQKLLTDGEYILWEGRGIARVQIAQERLFLRNFGMAPITLLIVFIMLTLVRDRNQFFMTLGLLYLFAMWTFTLSGTPPAPDEPLQYWYAVTNHRVLADRTDNVSDTVELPVPPRGDVYINWITETVGTVSFRKGVQFSCIENPEAVLAALERAAFLSEDAHRQ